jgi:hypothetical protein
MKRYIQRIQQSTNISVDLALALAIAIIHLGVAIYYKEARNLDILANPGQRNWDWWWQTIPVDLLMNDFWRSLWYMHFQPPLYNLYGAFFFYTIPRSSLEGMQFGNILLGALISGEIYLILIKLTKRRILSVTVSLFLALDVGIFVYEAYILYDILTLFLIITSVTILTLYWESKKISLGYLYLATICLLVLTRSVYHLLVVPVGIALVALYQPHQFKKIFLVGILISLIPLGWYVKNYSLFGFFGASSWQGLSLWKLASHNYTPEELDELKDAGVIHPIAAEVPVFSPASEYIPYGFNLESEIPLLNQDDQRNINVIAVGREYRNSAIEIIKHDPSRFVKSLFLAYRIFNLPSERFKHHVVNIQKIPTHVWLASDILQGYFLEDRFKIPMGSFYYLLIPLCPVIYIFEFIRTTRRKNKNPIAYVRGTLVETWIIFLIFYTTTVGVFFEIGENNRYKFYIESLVIVYLCVVASRYMPAIWEYISCLFKNTILRRACDQHQINGRTPG